MARPRKQTVDYFPHDTNASERRTLTIMESKYGIEGYAFWFKLLELLGKSPGHFYDFNAVPDLEFLSAKTTRNDTETTLNMTETLSVLGAIDQELFSKGIIWCQNFVDNIEDAYNRTIADVPEKPVNAEFDEYLHTEKPSIPTETPPNPTEMPEIKRNKKEKKRKEKNDTEVIDEKAVDIWNKALIEIKPLVSKKNYSTWFEDTIGDSYRDGNFLIAVPSEYKRQYLEKNQLSIITQAVKSVTGEETQVMLITSNNRKSVREEDNGKTNR